MKLYENLVYYNILLPVLQCFNMSKRCPGDEGNFSTSKVSFVFSFMGETLSCVPVKLSARYH